MLSRLGKCTACKQTSRRDYTETKAETKSYWIQVGVTRGTREVRRFGRTTRCDRWTYASDDCECPRCGKVSWNAKAIDGVVTERECDGRCINAKGHNCECACGGKNHGNAHLVCEAA